MLNLSVAADFRREFDAGVLLGVGVGPANTIVAAVAASSPREPRGLATLAEIVVLQDRTEHRIATHPIELAANLWPQPLPDGRVLLVERRQRPELPNATVLTGDGRVAKQFTVGDGVEDALVDDSGLLWVSYFDEGVFGRSDLSVAGLNQFDLEGQRIWAFQARGQLASIDDCYALNVDGSTAWAYYYSAFDVVHVEGGRVSRWNSAVKGSNGLLAVPDGVVLVDGFHLWSATFGRLGDGELFDFEDVAVNSAGRLPSRSELIGRGQTLWVMADGMCWKGTLTN